MDSFDFIEAWDAATQGRKTVPSVTVQMLLADAIADHLSARMSGKAKAA
jgi:hypothetical protein